MSRRKSMTCLVLIVAPFFALLVGCPLLLPPAEAILAGTWQLTAPGQIELTQLEITFDQNGSPSIITYKLGSVATVTVPAPGGTTTVNGQNVNVTATFLGQSLVFDGVLNNTNTVMTGNVTTRITAGGIVIDINNGPATLTKQ